jgi:hypothetical protein
MVKGSAGDKEPAIEQEFDRIGAQTKHTHTHQLMEKTGDGGYRSIIYHHGR